MKKINIFIIGISISLIIVVSLAMLLSKSVQLPIKEEVIISQQKSEKKVAIIIDDSEELSKMLGIEFKEGMTAFDLLSNKAEKLNLVLELKTYDIGLFIEAIGNKKNGEDGKYWLYYINGKMSQFAVDKQLLRPGDKVEFKFEEPVF